MARFLGLNYSTINIGDDIQTLAATQFLPRVDEYVNRDLLGKYKGPGGSLIANGWYMHDILHTRCVLPKGLRRVYPYTRLISSYSWPPAPSITPLFISVHCDHSAVKTLSKPALVSYYHKFSPIGCRDQKTLSMFNKMGIDAYFSGCLTLTLKNPCPDIPRGNKIYIVDLENTLKPCSYLPETIKNEGIFLSHTISKSMSPEARRALAETYLKYYATAQLVITSKLHCALPCVAMGTPVLFFPKNPDDIRFTGYQNIVNICSPNDFPEIMRNLDLNTIPLNLKPPADLIANLRKRCEDFVKSAESLFPSSATLL